MSRMWTQRTWFCSPVSPASSSACRMAGTVSASAIVRPLSSLALPSPPPSASAKNYTKPPAEVNDFRRVGHCEALQVCLDSATQVKAPSRTESAEATYVRTTPSSRALYEQACKVMPGGTTRTTVYFAPYPLYIERGQGAWVWDADGTGRLDFIQNYSALILGHAHPRVTAAIKAQLERRT